MPDSVDEWLEKAREHEATARYLARKHAPANTRSQVLFHAGFGVECALKALIMSKERLNRWPEATAPGGYWTHDLNKLRKKAGVQVIASDPIAPAWQIVITWTRSKDYEYNPNPTPLAVAQSYAEAAYGENGVVPWIKGFLP